MITIIKRGVPPSAVEYEAKCGHCHTEMRFHRHDAREHHEQRDGSSLIIACPVCNRDIWKSL